VKLPRLSTLIASVFGIGFFDVAPGTVMSFIAVPLAAMIGAAYRVFVPSIDPAIIEP
jgi:hypothetical protein